MIDGYKAHTIQGREARELLRRLLATAGEVVVEVVGAFVLQGMTGKPAAETMRAAWAKLPDVLSSETSWEWVEAMCTHASTADGKRITADRFDEVFAGRPWEAVEVAVEVATANGFFRLRAFSPTSAAT